MILLRRHMSFYLAAMGGVFALVAGVLLGIAHPEVLAADVFFCLYTLVALTALSRLTPERLRLYGASADAPVWIIFGVALATVALSIGALFLALNEMPRPEPMHLAMTLAAIPLGWATIHLMAALHYAHVYWRPDTDAEPRGEAAGGIEFPGTNRPGGWDFAYFALVIGMTAQTADINVTSTQMRKLVLLQSVAAFFFNTVIVAAAVNVAVTLGG